MHYSLKAKILPDQSRIVVSGRISGLPTKDKIPLYLNKSFAIRHVGYQGKSWHYTFDLQGDAPPYADVARPIYIDLRGDTVEFEYDGVIDQFVYDINIISSDLVEVAFYCGWFPFYPGMLFDYSVELALPSQYVVVSSGNMVSEDRSEEN